MTDLTWLTAQELPNTILQPQAPSQEVLQAHLQQVARHNPALNAILTLDEEHARQLAKEADEALARSEVWEPLQGVPFSGHIPPFPGSKGRGLLRYFL